MLTITIPECEFFNEETSEFFKTKAQTLTLEHSLVSISKWESKWEIPFLSAKEKTDEQIRDYVRCMTLTQNVSPDVYRYIPKSVLDEISDYINRPMTATTIRRPKGGGNLKIVTSEIIYYWMISLNIPMECQKWHLNRLMTLIEVCSLKNSPPKKRPTSEVLAEQRELNELRKKQYHTRG